MFVHSKAHIQFSLDFAYISDTVVLRQVCTLSHRQIELFLDWFSQWFCHIFQSINKSKRKETVFSDYAKGACHDIPGCLPPKTKQKTQCFQSMPASPLAWSENRFLLFLHFFGSLRCHDVLPLLVTSGICFVFNVKGRGIVPFSFERKCVARVVVLCVYMDGGLGLRQRQDLSKRRDTPMLNLLKIPQLTTQALRWNFQTE